MRKKSFGQNKESWIDHFIARLRYSQVEKFIRHKSSLLDLGCGYRGSFLRYMEQRITFGHGIDLSVEKQSTIRSPKITLIQSKIDIPLKTPSNAYDFITALAVIEHVDNPHQMVLEARRMLKKGGVLLITTPSKYGKLPLEIAAFLGLISKEEIADHKRYYDKQTLLTELKQAGFTDPHIHVSGFGIFGLNLFARAVKL